MGTTAVLWVPQQSYGSRGSVLWVPRLGGAARLSLRLLGVGPGSEPGAAAARRRAVPGGSRGRAARRRCERGRQGAARRHRDVGNARRHR